MGSPVSWRENQEWQMINSGSRRIDRAKFNRKLRYVSHNADRKGLSRQEGTSSGELE